MKILGIETSCDETGVCLVEGTGTFESHDVRFTVLGNALYSQIAVHAVYGGVYPNLARREHVNNLVPMLTECLKQANCLIEQPTPTTTASRSDLAEILLREPELLIHIEEFLRQYGRPNIDAIAVTHGPGLEPALWVGVNFAKALSAAWNIPIVAVNHMEGHSIISMFNATNGTTQCLLKKDGDETLGCATSKGSGSEYSMRDIVFSLLSILISGGHTEIVLSRSWREYEVIGQTYDDAIGEAFDKVARLMDLPYPGGPEISRMATQARERNLAERPAFALPRPVLHDGTFNFSFSGLKTAVRRIVESFGLMNDEDKMVLAREFENAAADVIVAKAMRAIEHYGVASVIVGGGVSANVHIRRRLAEAIDDTATLLFPTPSLATDNALMIAIAGYFDAVKGKYINPNDLRANGNLSL